MLVRKNGNWESAEKSGDGNQRDHSGEVTTMRSLGWVRVLLIVALLAVPVAAVSADVGTAGGGYVWDGASDWPGVTSIIIPESLPEAGNSRASISVPSDPPLSHDWAQVEDVQEAVEAPWDVLLFNVMAEPPAALPATGFNWDRALREAYAQLRHDGSVAPAALPETGFNWDRALREAYAQLRHDGSVAPAALPETGFNWDRALREAYAQLRHDGSVAPATLPETARRTR